MPLALPLIAAARNLISSFGNNAALYPWSSVVKATTEEGDEIVALWVYETGTTLFTGTCDAGGTTTRMNDVGVDFSATAEAGDYVILDGVEWGTIVTANDGYITFASLSLSGSCATARAYKILDSTATDGETIKVVDGGNQGIDLVQGNMGQVEIGEDEKIIRDDVTIAVNDRLTYAGKNYKITSVKEERVESSVIISIITVDQTTDTTNW